MARPSLSETLTRFGEKTANGVRKARVVQVFAGSAVIQDSRGTSIATATTDEPIRTGDSVWTQPTKQQGGIVIHGRV